MLRLYFGVISTFSAVVYHYKMNRGLQHHHHHHIVNTIVMTAFILGYEWALGDSRPGLATVTILPFSPRRFLLPLS